MKWNRERGVDQWIALLVGMVLLWAVSAPAASFDCTKARTAVEKMICANAELSKLDEEIQPLYQQANQRTADPVGFRAEQRQWLKLRDSCNDAGCVAQTYRSRLAALHSFLQAPKPCFRLLERKWPEVASGHYPVCVDVLKSMNALCGDIPLCAWKISPSVPSLSLPQWEELDPKKYLKLIQHMYQTPRTFDAPEEQWTPIPSDVLRNIQERKAHLWSALIDVDQDGEKENVVKLRAHSCEDGYGTEFYAGSMVNVANASMNRLDLRYDGFSTAAMDLMLHGNRAFVIARNSDLEFSVEEPFSTREGMGKGKTSVCVFEYLKQ
ncbi:MAG: lysozyme inhibitor LprI family protein [Desulfobulbus sp.]|jgi:uncharacterized protein YecT (DUF1311 family)|uniref:lysozyme inhibitor LprI family protein n=1 Tax=Desulfobulbus sp. TaxID=895 RepID=UPI00283EB270|nr:lysozyme inhibitor LprI family protein [Desulfobulbus sp.]MDR2549439.1 lysozyme inhibitor LprI family protein [Desulfobulbus sp.]